MQSWGVQAGIMQWSFPSGLSRPKPPMPPSRKHHNRIREFVLQRAGRLFNRHGFNAVSIDDVMAEAGLTRGSFYCYFTSKSDLYAQSVARIVHESPESTNGAGSERIKADKIVRDYLSDQDTPATDETFPMIGLPNDVSRTDRAVRQAFEAALKVMVDSFEKTAAGSNEARHGGPMRSPLPLFASAAWSCRGRSTIRNSVSNCGRLQKRSHLISASGDQRVVIGKR